MTDYRHEKRLWLAALIVLAMAMLLILAQGCVSAAQHSGKVQGAFDKIAEHTSAARALLKPDLSRPNVQQADDELAQVLPLIASGKSEAAAVQGAFDTLDHKWYVRAGRKVDAAIKTIIWVSVIALIAYGVFDFYTGLGKAFAKRFFAVVGKIIQVAAHGPVAAVHYIGAWIIGKIKRVAGVAPGTLAAEPVT